MSVTIYHNPRCSKSRETLALLRSHGVEPIVVDYLSTPLSEVDLRQLLDLLGMKPRELLRRKDAKEAGLDDPGLSDDALIAGMIANPRTMERPIVVHRLQARLGRPPEKVLEIL